MTLESRGPVVPSTCVGLDAQAAGIAVARPARTAPPQQAAEARVRRDARLGAQDAKVAGRAAKQAMKLGRDRFEPGASQPATLGLPGDAREARRLAARMREQARALAGGGTGKLDEALREALDTVGQTLGEDARPREVAARLREALRGNEADAPSTPAPAVGLLAVPIGAGVTCAVVIGGPSWFGA